MFIRGSSAHNIWTYYADEPEGIVAYRVNVIEEKDGIVVGTVHPLNYREQVRRVLTHAIPATLVTLRYESGLTVTVPFADYPRNLPIIRPQNGGIQSVRFEVQDEAALEAALCRAPSGTETSDKKALFPDPIIDPAVTDSAADGGAVPASMSFGSTNDACWGVPQTPGTK